MEIINQTTYFTYHSNKHNTIAQFQLNISIAEKLCPINTGSMIAVNKIPDYT